LEDNEEEEEEETEEKEVVRTGCCPRSRRLSTASDAICWPLHK
jgi:hypothetical protein